MREIQIPEFDEDEDGWDAKEKYLDTLGIDWAYLDYKPWRVLESVDSILNKHGLEIVYFSEGEEFGIAKLEV